MPSLSRVRDGVRDFQKYVYVRMSKSHWSKCACEHQFRGSGSHQQPCFAVIWTRCMTNLFSFRFCLARVMLPRLLSDRFVIIPTDFLVRNFNKIETMSRRANQVLHYFLFYFLLCSYIKSKSFQNSLRFQFQQIGEQLEIRNINVDPRIFLDGKVYTRNIFRGSILEAKTKVGVQKYQSKLTTNNLLYLTKRDEDFI